MFGIEGEHEETYHTHANIGETIMTYAYVACKKTTIRQKKERA